MAQTTIEWTSGRRADGSAVPGFTFNPWEGCEKISPACANCYAAERDRRFHGGNHWGPNSSRLVHGDSYWRQPLKWNRDAAAAGERRRVFCASLADVFEDRPELIEPRRRLFKLIQATPNLDWLLLTKRPENIYSLTYKAIDPADDPDCDFNIAGEPNGLEIVSFGELYPNIWLGTTVENQEQADKRIPELLKIPARVRFLSCEPLLSAVDLGFALARIHWVIAGGESGPNARPMQIKWARSLRDQCQAAGVAFHFKQWGGTNKKAAGRILDGRTWDEFPRTEAR